MREWIEQVRRLVEGEVVNFPGNPRPTNSLAAAQGGASVHGFPEHVPLDSFAQGYVEAALWSSTDDNGDPLDADHDQSDIASPALKAMAADCADFQQRYADLLDKAYETDGYGGPTQAGHDFWLTRNGHGAGFWDRGLGPLGTALTKAAHSYGECDLYIGDDKMIYVS